MSLITRASKGAPLSAEDHDANLRELAGFDSLEAMLADTERGYGLYDEGQTVVALKQGWRYRVAAAGASDHHLTTAAGLKLYVLPDARGVYNFRAFNPAADGSTDDNAKILQAITPSPLTSTRPSVVFFPAGNYRSNSTLQINFPVTMLGIDENSIISFPTDVAGVVINAANTRDGSAIPLEDAIGLGMTSGAGTKIDGVRFTGTGGQFRTSAHGLQLKAPATILNTDFFSFSGNGIHLECWSEEKRPDNPELWGGADGWYMDRVSAVRNGRAGIRVRGDRVSGYSHTGNATTCGLWGFDCHAESAVIFVGAHSATNGVGPGAGNISWDPVRSSMVHYEGNRYRAVWVDDGHGDCIQEQLQKFVDVTPGTDPTVWSPRGSGGVHTWYPTWVAGQAVGHYFPGGGYKATGEGSCILAGCYAENDDPGALFSGSNITSIGGIKTHVIPPGSQWRASNGGDMFTAETATQNGGMSVTMIPDVPEDVLLSWHRDGGASYDFRWIDGVDIGLFADNEMVFRSPGINTAETFGTSGTVGRIFHTPVLAVGDGAGGRRVTYADAAPATGEWAQGDRVYNAAASPGGWAAWVCVEAGSPGTWALALQIQE